MTMAAHTFDPARSPVNEIGLCGWIGQAAPGDVIEYHRGFLVVDVNPLGTRLPVEERTELSRVAQRAWWASERGLVHLVQHRAGPEVFRYLAIARAPAAKQPAAQSLSQLLNDHIPSEEAV
jgi:hypothetical protein